MAYNILGDVQEAEDIVQDVFESRFSTQRDVQFPKDYENKFHGVNVDKSLIPTRD